MNNPFNEYIEEESNRVYDTIFPIETLGIDNSLEPDAPVRIVNPSPEEDILSDEHD